MIYSKKLLFIFSVVVLSTTAIAGFFIRQKILNDWKIVDLNFFLKQVKELETEISNFEEDLKKNKKLQTSVEERNQFIEQKIKELEEFIDNYGAKIEKLSIKGIPNKRARGFQNVLNQYKLFKKNKEENKTKTELSKQNKLFPIYEKIVLNYFNYKHNTSKQLQKYQNIKQEAKEQKTSFNEEMKKNKNFLSELKNLFSQLTTNIENKKLKLITLRKSREREREREKAIS